MCFVRLNRFAIAGAMFLLSCTMLCGQNLQGVTGVRDTGFTPEGEFNRMSKSYPSIQLVRERIGEGKVTKDIIYREVDGKHLTADIYHSSTDGLSPGILVIHGGGWRSGGKRQLTPLAQRLASRGFTCVAMDYRLSTEALYPAAICDVKAAVAWMVAHADSLRIDPAKIAIMGFSAGGHLAALAGTTFRSPAFADLCGQDEDGEIQAIIDIDGILAFIHPESGEGNDTKSTSAATYWFGYTKEQRQDLWIHASPLTHVSEKTPPTLFINSSVDRMHAGRDDFIRALDQWGIYHETKVFPDAPHSFCLFEPWFTPTVDSVVDFLNRVFSHRVPKSQQSPALGAGFTN